MKTILVIGGSSGIGNAVVKQQLEKNKVINFSRTPAQISHTNFTQYTLDATQDPLPELQAIDAIIYCPGSIVLKPFSRLSVADFSADFSINVLGAVRVIQTYLKVLQQSSSASIVLFSSVATALGMPFHSSIATAKAAVEGLTKSLAAELAPKVRVNAIAPTVTNTPLAKKLLRNEKAIENLIERHPLKGYLQADEVATMADVLLHTPSISGQILAMDYGITTLKI